MNIERRILIHGLALGIVLGLEREGDPKHLENFGLAPGDQWIEVDGVPVGSMGNIIATQDRIISDIDQGLRKGFSVTVLRGAFRELVISYDVLRD